MGYTIKFTISAAPAITNYFIAVLYKTTAPAAEVDRILMGNDHSSPQNCTFTDLLAGTYIVKIHDSVDNSTLGNLRHDFWIDSKSNQILFERRFYQVDGAGENDPVSTDPDNTKIVDAYFDGKTITGIFQEGYRYLIDGGVEWEQVPGQLNLKNDKNTGEQIKLSPSQIWMVEITYPNADGASTTPPFTDVIVLTTNTTLNTTHYNKVLAVNSASASQTTTGPSVGTIPDGTGFMVIHDGGTAVNVKFALPSGQAFRFRGSDVNYILLAKGEFVKVVKKFSKLYVIEYRGQWDRLGEMINGDVIVDNSLICDGTNYDGNIYLRLYDFVANKVPTGQVSTLADWTANPALQTNFAINTTTKEVIVPDRRDFMIKALKVVGIADPDRTNNQPGSQQPAQVGQHNIILHKGDSYAGHTTSAGRFAPGGGGSSIQPDDTITQLSGKENWVKNIGAIPLLLI